MGGPLLEEQLQTVVYSIILLPNGYNNHFFFQVDEIKYIVERFLQGLEAIKRRFENESEVSEGPANEQEVLLAHLTNDALDLTMHFLQQHFGIDFNEEEIRLRVLEIFELKINNVLGNTR